MKFQPGDLMLVEFFDHCSGIDHLLKFVTMGRLIAIDRDRILLDYWAYLDPAVERDINVDRVAVSLGSVISMTRLKKAETIIIKRKIATERFYTK